VDDEEFVAMHVAEKAPQARGVRDAGERDVYLVTATRHETARVEVLPPSLVLSREVHRVRVPVSRAFLHRWSDVRFVSGAPTIHDCENSLWVVYIGAFSTRGHHCHRDIGAPDHFDDVLADDDALYEHT